MRGLIWVILVPKITFLESQFCTSADKCKYTVVKHFAKKGQESQKSHILVTNYILAIGPLKQATHILPVQ